MSQTGIFTKHVQKANEWINQIEELTGPKSDKKKSLAALRTVLHQLRDNLPIESALHLSAQLPLIIKGIFFENWHLSDCQTKDKSIDIFLDGVEEELRNADVDVEIWTYAVLQVLSSHISPGETEKIRNVLPHEIRKLWDEGCAA
jgi:uncharacterized protein (DUF2267 family)